LTDSHKAKADSRKARAARDLASAVFAEDTTPPKAKAPPSAATVAARDDRDAMLYRMQDEALDRGDEERFIQLERALENRRQRRMGRDEDRSIMPQIAQTSREIDAKRAEDLLAILQSESARPHRESLNPDDEGDEAAMLKFLEKRGEMDLRENVFVDVDEKGEEREHRHMGHTFRRNEEDDRNLDAEGVDLLAHLSEEDLAEDVRHVFAGAKTDEERRRRIEEFQVKEFAERMQRRNEQEAEDLRRAN